MGKFRTLLLDLDGTLYVEGQWIPGVPETLWKLIERNITLRFITNTTMRSRRQLQERFKKAGIDVPGEWFFTPAVAARTYFNLNRPDEGVCALVHPDLLEDLEGIPLTDEERSSYVLVGDMGDAWTIQELNRALRCLLNGAELTALQKNRFWMARDGYRLDAGAFVTALEYASGKSCSIIFGKPNPVFFQMVLESTGSRAEETLMVGDDLEADVLGARKAGIRGYLVRTGKSRDYDWEGRITEADGVIDHLEEILNVIA